MNTWIVVLIIFCVFVSVLYYRRKNAKYGVFVYRVGERVYGTIDDVDSQSFPKILIEQMQEGKPYIFSCRRRKENGKTIYYLADDYIVSFHPISICGGKIVGSFVFDGEEILGYMENPDVELHKTYKALYLIYEDTHPRYGSILLYMGE